MKSPFLFCVSLAVAAVAVGAEVGESYDQVLQNQGKPLGKMQAGNVVILNYPGETVRIERGKVISVKVVSIAPNAVPKPVAPARVVEATPTPVVVEPPAELTWLTDYAAALGQAKKQNRKTLLFFTGSDWCVWCAKLEREVLSTPEFKRYAQDKLVLVKLDFPQKTKLPSGVQLQNDQLAKKYAIEGYPTVIVLDSAGKKVNQLGYSEGGPAPFIADLK